MRSAAQAVAAGLRPSQALRLVHSTTPSHGTAPSPNARHGVCTASRKEERRRPTGPTLTKPRRFRCGLEHSSTGRGFLVVVTNSCGRVCCIRPPARPPQPRAFFPLSCVARPECAAPSARRPRIPPGPPASAPPQGQAGGFAQQHPKGIATDVRCRTGASRVCSFGRVSALAGRRRASCSLCDTRQTTARAKAGRSKKCMRQAQFPSPGL